MGTRVLRGLFLLLLVALAPPALASSGAAELGANMELLLGIPFAGILLSIALCPLVAPHFWHQHFGKISAFWGLALAIPFVAMYRMDAVEAILHTYIIEYIPFIILLWALYTVAGGILVTGSLSGSPLVNVGFLVIGTSIASWVGTTGAAMLLIRPFLKANAWRKQRTYQVVFFIFLVCNIGGALTPLGDPPLFLGFLQGVDFFWTLNLFKPMLLVSVILLTVFFVMDTYYYKKEEGVPPESDEKFKIEGLHNIIFLVGIIVSVLCSGIFAKDMGKWHLWGIERNVADYARDAFLIVMGVLSLRTTKQSLRERNEFTWFPIVEVGYLFAGIFVTMTPVILILSAGKAGALSFVANSVESTTDYFWVTGLLSSFLDNAPTYLVFLKGSMGSFGATVGDMMTTHGDTLLAISCGAVFMGANSYIGNAPNFMVRSIAEEGGVAMPSFFGYILKYSLVFLMPTFVVVTYFFFL
jgi:Na+/H+ antiporter NhaD/arsenite permease-like protein